jgi:hypothetical protein
VIKQVTAEGTWVKGLGVYWKMLVELIYVFDQQKENSYLPRLSYCSANGP